ncbi:MAG TPA: MFS transporter, partial [Burkholderiales bacterium]
MSATALSRPQLVTYSVMAVPLAMAALPVYVHVPKLYAGELGMPLALIGAILLAARLFDAFQDPL